MTAYPLPPVDELRNSVFSAARFGATNHENLMLAAYLSLHEDYSVSVTDIDELQVAKAAALLRTAEVFDRLWSKLRKAIKD